jgi:hypothetical protein
MLNDAQNSIPDAPPTRITVPFSRPIGAKPVQTVVRSQPQALGDLTKDYGDPTDSTDSEVGVEALLVRCWQP